MEEERSYKMRPISPESYDPRLLPATSPRRSVSQHTSPSRASSISSANTSRLDLVDEANKTSSRPLSPLPRDHQTYYKGRKDNIGTLFGDEGNPDKNHYSNPDQDLCGAIRDLAKLVRYSIKTHTQNPEQTRRALSLSKSIAQADRQNILGVDAHIFEQEEANQRPNLERFDSSISRKRDRRSHRSSAAAVQQARGLLLVTYSKPLSTVGPQTSAFLKELISLTNQLDLSDQGVHHLCTYFLRGKLASAYDRIREKRGTLKAIEFLAERFHSEESDETYSTAIKDWKFDLKADPLSQMYSLLLCYTASRHPRTEEEMITLIKERTLEGVPQHVRNYMEKLESSYRYKHKNRAMKMIPFAKALKKKLDELSPKGRTKAAVDDITVEDSNYIHNEEMDHNNFIDA